MSSGGDSGGDPPVSIPNTEVKPASADGTWGADPRESRTPPGTTLRAVRSVRAALAFAARELAVGCRHREPATRMRGLDIKQTPDDRSDDLPERSDGGERTPVRDR